MGVLSVVSLLLDRNRELGITGRDLLAENEERLYDVPIRMLSDINQQVRKREGVPMDRCVCMLVHDFSARHNYRSLIIMVYRSLVTAVYNT